MMDSPREGMLAGADDGLILDKAVLSIMILTFSILYLHFCSTTSLSTYAYQFLAAGFVYQRSERHPENHRLFWDHTWSEQPA